MARIANPFLECLVELPYNLKKLPLRRSKVLGQLLVVPQHITRIETKDGGTIGWQVRYKCFSKFFRDGDLDACDSLKQALDYLSSVY